MIAKSLIVIQRLAEELHLENMKSFEKKSNLESLVRNQGKTFNGFISFQDKSTSLLRMVTTLHIIYFLLRPSIFVILLNSLGGRHKLLHFFLFQILLSEMKNHQVAVTSRDVCRLWPLLE